MTRKTRIAAARSVSDEPIVETSWAVQSREKRRFRNTENIDGLAVAWAMSRPPCALGKTGRECTRPIPSPKGARPAPVPSLLYSQGV